MTSLYEAAQDLMTTVQFAIKSGDWKVDGACDPSIDLMRLRKALAQSVDAVPGFTVTEPRQSLSRMKPGDRFVLVRTGEIYRIENDGSQWNETRQRLARLHKNSQVRLIVDAVNMNQERVDETVKGEHEPVAWAEITKDYVAVSDGPFENAAPLYKAPPKREWVGLTHEERDQIDQTCRSQMEALFAVEAALKDKNGG